MLYAGLGALMEDPNISWTGVRSVLPTAIVYDLVLSAFVVPAVLVLARRAEPEQLVFS